MRKWVMMTVVALCWVGHSLLCAQGRDKILSKAGSPTQLRSKQGRQQLPDITIETRNQRGNLETILSAIAEQSLLEVVAELPEKIQEVNLSAKRLPLSILLAEVTQACRSEVILEQKTIIVSPRFPPVYSFNPFKDIVLYRLQERKHLLNFVRTLSASQLGKLGQGNPIPIANLDQEQRQELENFFSFYRQGHELKKMAAEADLAACIIVFCPRISIYLNGKFGTPGGIYLRQHVFHDNRVLQVDADSGEMRFIDYSKFLKIKRSSAVPIARVYLCGYEPSSGERRAKRSARSSLRTDEKIRLPSRVTSLDEICSLMRAQADMQVYVGRRHGNRRLYLSRSEYQRSRLLNLLQLCTKLEQRKIGSDVILLAEYAERNDLSRYERLPSEIRKVYGRSTKEFDSILAFIAQRAHLEKEGIPFASPDFLKRLTLKVKDLDKPKLAFVQSEFAAFLRKKHHFETSSSSFTMFPGKARFTEADLAEAVGLLGDYDAVIELSPEFVLQIRQYKKALVRGDVVFYRLLHSGGVAVN